MGEYLTAEQIEKFQKDGILVVENFLSQDEVKNMREEILKLVQCGPAPDILTHVTVNASKHHDASGIY